MDNEPEPKAPPPEPPDALAEELTAIAALKSAVAEATAARQEAERQAAEARAELGRHRTTDALGRAIDEAANGMVIKPAARPLMVRVLEGEGFNIAEDGRLVHGASGRPATERIRELLADDNSGFSVFVEPPTRGGTIPRNPGHGISPTAPKAAAAPAGSFQEWIARYDDFARENHLESGD